MTDHERVPGTAAASVVPSFLAELSRAMQAAAEQERERIAAVVAEEATGQVDMARARAAVEADELRRMAEDDVTGIRAWAAEETERIRREASQRTDERRSELEAHLAKHDSIIATEIAGVDVAVIDYRSTLDRFFDELRDSTDPAEIARKAGSLPPPPDLESVRAVARAGAVEKLANAPDEAEQPVAEAPEAAFETAEAPPADAPVADAGVDGEPAAEAEAGLGVMDPDAEAERGLGVMDPEAEGRPEELPVEPATEGVAAASVQRSSAAVRMLRSIAPWTLNEPDDEDHGTHSS